MLSIEAFIATNFLMNLLILSISARNVGHTSWRRIVAASGIGTAYAAAAYGWYPVLRGFAGQTVCLLTMALAAFAVRKKGRRWARGSLATAAGCIFAGGVMTLLNARMKAGSPLMTAAGWMIVAACAFFGDSIRRRGSAESTVLLRISTRMGSVEVEALVDTGNRLHEPISGLPVIIVGKRYMHGILDEACLEQSAGRLPPGFRIVRYGVLGGSGEMQCFRPESVCILRGGCWSDIPDVWIAICSEDIPSGVEALAPAIF